MKFHGGATLVKWSRISLFGCCDNNQEAPNDYKPAELRTICYKGQIFFTAKYIFFFDIHVIGLALVYIKATAVVVYLRCQITGL